VTEGSVVIFDGSSASAERRGAARTLLDVARAQIGAVRVLQTTSAAWARGGGFRR
jgi:hypothetical protein